MRKVSDAMPMIAPDHPAVRAWGELHDVDVDTAIVTALKPQTEARHKSGVYRLEGILPDGRSVIAKRARWDAAQMERRLYMEVLPQLRLQGLKCYGFLEELDATFCWLFLEDAGDVAFSATVPAHRVLLAGWLGRLHTSSAARASQFDLPDRGLAHHYQHLQAACDLISHNVSNPALRRDEACMLKTTVRHLERVGRLWPKLAVAYEQMPEALVHGDIKPKNVRIREDQTPSLLAAFDWEQAGRARSTVDLYAADVLAYWQAVRPHWPNVTLRAVERAAAVSRLLRTVAAVRWDAHSLAHPWVERAAGRIRCLLADLKRQLPAIEEMG